VSRALPGILTGMRIGIGFGWTTLAAAGAGPRYRMVSRPGAYKPVRARCTRMLAMERA
jgi:hypothetical protein